MNSNIFTEKRPMVLFVKRFALLILGCVFFHSTVCFASVSLSVNPLTGGNSLRFGRVGSQGQVSKEVKIRITSTDDKQYQVYQRLNNQLTNELGQSIAHNSVKSYAISGSNAFGALYNQNQEAINSSDQLLYTSSQNGDSDSFTIVYTVNPAEIDGGGNYFGKILYIVRPFGSGSQDQAFLNVYLDIKGDLEFRVEGSSLGNAVRLSSKDSKNSGYAKLIYDGNIGNEIKIYQEVNQLPVDQSFNELESGALDFYIQSDSSKAMTNYNSQSDLPRGRKLIYTSEEGKGEIYVHYVLDQAKLQMQKSGQYRSHVMLTIESGSVVKSEEINLEVEVLPVFELEIVLPPEGMRFDNLLPMNPPQVKEIGVRVRTNLGKPYTVNQIVNSPMTNENGQTIVNENFSLRGEVVGDSKGKFQYTQYEPVKADQESIFISDNKGSPAEFKVFYRLKPYPEMMAGSYSTSIVYSLGEI